MPATWREAIAKRCAHGTEESDNSERIQQQRTDLEAEQKRLVTLFTKGYITEDDLDKQMEIIRSELFSLPVIVARSTQESTQAAISAGETFLDMAGYWSEATSEERRDIVWSLLKLEGLIYDLERVQIIGLLPRESMLPVLALGLEKTARWEQHDGGLWLRTEYWPPKLERGKRHLPPPLPSLTSLTETLAVDINSKRHLPPPLPSLTPVQQEEAMRLLKDEGMSLRKVAAVLGTSRETIRRLAQKEGIELQTSQKLTIEEREDAFRLLDMGISLRQVAKQFGVTAESLRRLVKRQRLG